jgi:hypothetical protein
VHLRTEVGPLIRAQHAGAARWGAGPGLELICSLPVLDFFYASP